jgi:predicted MFS family arabinose efflux permease
MALIATALSTEAPARRRPMIDYPGLVLFTAGISALLFGVLERGRADAWTSGGVLWPILIAVVVLVVFVGVERRAPDPIVPLRLFGNRMVLAASATGFLAGMAMFGAISFVPLFLQNVTGASAMRAGSVLTPFILGWTAFSVVSARIVFRVGYRNVVLAGMVALTVAFVLFARWTGSLTTGTAMRDTLIAGIGMGCTMVPMLIAVQSAVAREDLGAATSMTQFFRTVGGAIGLSLMGAMMADRLRAGAPMAQALHGVFVVGLVVCTIAVVAAFLVPAGRARDLAAERIAGAPTRAEG